MRGAKHGFVTAERPKAVPEGRGRTAAASIVEEYGAIAQLGERLHGMQDVSGSIPLSSTKHRIHILGKQVLVPIV